MAMQIADWLSSKITVAPAGLFFRSDISCRIQTASCAALASAMYSDSAVDKATHGCFLLFQRTAAPLILNMYPDTDLLSSRSPAQSASEYPMHSSSLSLQ